MFFFVITVLYCLIETSLWGHLM